MEKKFFAKWIGSHDFQTKDPIDVFRKENSSIDNFEIHPENIKNHHMLVRKEFYLPLADSSYFLDITADDYYKLYINGKFIGQGPAPGYPFHYYVNRFDISGYLEYGVNVIAVHVYYQGLINRVWNSGDLRQGLTAELFCAGRIITATDSTWKYIRAREYLPGKIIGYMTQYIENIDCRLRETGWKERGFDDSKWVFAKENPRTDYSFFLQDTPPLEVWHLRPEKIIRKAAGEYFVDFGHEITGQVDFFASGKNGDEVEILCGEETLENNETSVRYNMRSNCEYKETWTLSGRQKESPGFFDYKAFRFCEIKDYGEAVDPDSIIAIVRHYPFNDSAVEFSCSDKILQGIWDICVNGVRYGTQEGYLDCPGREKGQYLGDMTVTAHSHMLLTGDGRLFKKALREFALSSKICPGLLAVAPGSHMQEIADYSLQWPMQIITYYKYTGDVDFLREMFPYVKGLEDYFSSFAGEDGLLENFNEKWNLVDWPEHFRDGYDFKGCAKTEIGCHNVINALYYGMLKNISTIESILGKTISKDYEKVKESFLKVFFDNKEKRFVDAKGSGHSSLHSNIFPLYFGMVSENGPLENVIEFVKSKRMGCSVYMAYFLLKALCACGEYKYVFELLTSGQERSWYNMVRQGATTCFEAWGKDQKWNTSLCHPWAGAPISIIVEEILGVNPGVPGWKEIIFEPKILTSLNNARCTLATPVGTVSVCVENGKANIDVPEGIPLIQHNEQIIKCESE